MTTKLILGAGHKIYTDAITVDNNPDCKPDVLWDLNKLPLPFKKNQFTEIHAYEVLEHLGRQGDYQSYFDLFNELGRILKKGGKIIGSVPRWERIWAWADPGHSRIITRGTLMFLDKANYAEIGLSPISDYRRLLKCSFRIIQEEYNDYNFKFILEKV